MKIGDRVKITSTKRREYHNLFATIFEKGGGWDWRVRFDNEDWHIYDEKDLQLIKEEPMSLRSRIEALNNGWDKKADDILQEIYGERGFWMEFIIRMDSGEGFIHCKWASEEAEFSYTSQCKKNQAFKDALLWLLDESGLEKQPKKDDFVKVEVDKEMWEATLVRKL